MSTPTPPDKLTVPFNLRLPWKYKRQLQAEANTARTSLHALIMEAVERRYPPKTES